MVQKRQLASMDPPSLHAILNRFLNFNSTIHFGRNIDSDRTSFSVNSQKLSKINPNSILDDQTIHSVLVSEAHALGQNAPRYTADSEKNMHFLKPA